MKIIHKSYEHPVFKVTIEELDSDCFIATDWHKEHSTEHDRFVFQFETYSGACDKAFDLIADWMTAVEQYHTTKYDKV